MDDNIVPALAVTCIFGLPVIAWIVTRVLAHQERMEMLRRGIVPPPNAREMRRAMKCGWTPDAMHQDPTSQYVYYNADVQAQQQLRKGMQVACIGMALLIGLSFIGHHDDGSFAYGPWLLGGLIPLFVGIAQIIGAVMSGATFGPAATRQRFGAPPAGPAPGPRQDAGMTPPPGPTYGGWRPGPTPEIEKPASPPDYRS